MKHRVGFNRLGRKPSHRKALHRNMVTSLFKHERIRTTKAKAQAIRRTAEKMITRAKVDSVHNRRIVAKDLKDKAVLAKLFVDIAPRFTERPGGYTRILRIGARPGDAAEMVLLELVGEMVAEKETKSKKADSKKTSAPKKAGREETGKKASKAKAAEVKAEEPQAVAPAEAEATAETDVAEEPVAETEASEIDKVDEAAPEEGTPDSEEEEGK